MSKLEKLEEELYGTDEHAFAKRRPRGTPSDGTAEKPPTSWIERMPMPSPVRSLISAQIIKFVVGVGVVVVVGLAALVLFFYLGSKGREAELAIYDRGPVEAGELVTVPIVFRNTSRTILRDAELTVVLPIGTIVNESGEEHPAPLRITKALGDLQPDSDGTVEISVRFFGTEGETQHIQATLLYRPDNLSARFSARASETIEIKSVPLALVWDLPATLSQGQDVAFTVRYTSSARGSFSDVALRLEYPPGFTYFSAEPMPSFENTIWQIGTLATGGEGAITVRGKINGEEAEIKSFHAGLGVFSVAGRTWKPYYELSREVAIAVTPLSVQGFLSGSREGIVMSGDHLNFMVRYKNNTDVILRNVSVRASVETNSLGASGGTIPGFLDAGSIAIDNGGVFDTERGEIVWAPSGTKELQEVLPGETGDVTFSVASKARPPVRSSSDKNFLVRLHASIDTAHIPEEFAGRTVRSEDALDFKVSSPILFAARSLYRTTPLSNSGPLPPRVGEKTTYTIFWEIRNFTNDLSSTVVSITLPPNVQWENAIIPNDARITYDAASGNVQWTVGELRAGTGVITPALTAAFRVSITPSPSESGQPMALAGESTLTAHDLFTGEKREERVHNVTTELREDPRTSVSDWTVVK